MGYVETSLVPGETVLYRARLSKFIFLPGLVLLVIVIGVLFLAWEWLTYRSTEMAITNRRVLIKRGVITRHTFEMNLTKIENVHVEQGPLARLLGYGSVTITGTGSTHEKFGFIANPLGFRRAITDAQAPQFAAAATTA